MTVQEGGTGSEPFRPGLAVVGGAGNGPLPIPSSPVSLPGRERRRQVPGQEPVVCWLCVPSCTEAPVLKEADGVMLMMAFLGVE